MSNTKFTPGPWTPGLALDKFVVSSNDTEICEVYGLEEESRANTSLMAAAPEMYAAMQSFCTDFENDYVMPDGSVVDNPSEILVQNYNAFKSILAAARGEGN